MGKAEGPGAEDPPAISALSAVEDPMMGPRKKVIIDMTKKARMGELKKVHTKHVNEFIAAPKRR